MIARIQPRKLAGKIVAIPSKSEAHRMLICAALADKPTRLHMGAGSEDIEATIRCLRAFGARIDREGDSLKVSPISEIPAACEADCGESGSTLRFLLPVAGALGIDTRFRMHGRLPQRPIFPLDRELIRGGCALERPEGDVLRIRGKLQPGSYALPGDVSSQYISGMLFALSLLKEESALQITGRVESSAYIEMTLRALKQFGAAPQLKDSLYTVPGMGGFVSPGEARIGGDWSNAAFWFCIDALPGCSVQVTGLDMDSPQGDRGVLSEIEKLRAQASCTIDAANIPDLIPTLAACACGRGQEATVVNAARLRIKESDRLEAIARTLNALGAAIEETADGLFISAGHPLRGGAVHSYGDHRIAMMAAVASCACTDEVIIHGAEAVNKSYPGFWRDFAALGGKVELEG